MVNNFNEIIFDTKQLHAARDEFLNTGKLRKGLIRDEILESWKRCKAYGLDPNVENILIDISEEEKNKLLSENSLLITTARPFLENLVEVIKELQIVVYLTNKDAVILYAIGEESILAYSQSKVSVPGGRLDERHAGTNTVAFAIALDRPYQMVGEEHYLQLIHAATSVAAPIHDENGQIIGTLNITAKHIIAQTHPYALGMILAGAKVIESQLRLQKEFETSFLANQYFNAAIESLGVGSIILNQDNVITHINQAAERIIRVSAHSAVNKKIEAFIKSKDILEAIQEKRILTDREVILGGDAGTRRCLVRLRPIFDNQQHGMGSVIFLNELAAVQKFVQKVAGFKAQYTFQDIWGESKGIQAAREVAKTIAKGPGNVIITGESGTGKELFAQSIHNASLNSAGPFLGINCATIPNDLIESELFGYEAGTFTGGLREGRSGKLEMANGGTLFLDEINGMPLDMQVKLLRVLEEKKFLRLGGKSYFKLEARIIAATNKDLKEEMALEKFRSDLYYRLSIFEIHIPPLRERKGDIKLLANMFLRDLCVKTGKKIDRISPEAMAYLENYQWPGNVRELKNWIERALFLTKGSCLTLDDFPQDSPGKTKANRSPLKVSLGKARNQAEMDAIKAALEECDGNISEASKRLCIGRVSLYRKLRKYNFSLSKIVFHEDK